MLWLRRGDRFPTVAMIQYVLNQTPVNQTPKKRLAVDGHFGLSTYNRVIEFQRLCKINDNGVGGPFDPKYKSKKTKCAHVKNRSRIVNKP